MTADQAASVDPAVAEMNFWTQLLAFDDDVTIVHGLPATLFPNSRALFARSDRPSSSNRPDPMPRLVFVTLNSALATQLSQQGAESYVISDIRGLDRSHEIESYEQAHRAFAAAFATMGEVERDVALLNADDDLPIVALAYHLPAIRDFLKRQDGNTRLILAQRGINDSVQIASVNLDLLYAEVKGVFKQCLFTKIGKGTLSKAALFEANAQVTEERYTRILGDVSRSCTVPALDGVKLKRPVLLNVKYPIAHFSYDVIWQIAAELERMGAEPILVSEGEQLIMDLAKQRYPVVDLSQIAITDDKPLAELAMIFRSAQWPYNHLQTTQSWRKRLLGQFRRVARSLALIDVVQPLSLFCYPFGSQIGRALRLGAKWHGIASYTPRLLGVAGHARGFAVMDDSTVFLVYGEEAREGLEKFGVAARQAVITGNPRYDDVPAHIARRNEYRREILGASNEDAVLALVATTGLIELDRMWLDAACRSAASLGVKLVIKPHPALSPAEYAPWTEAHTAVTVWQGDLNAAAAACDCMLTDYSSTGWEAVLYGRPLIVVNFSGHEFAYRWEDEGVGCRVSNEAELHEELANVAAGCFSPDALAGQKCAVSRYNHLNDGKATQRIAAILVGQ